jgi:hypothetical protein
MAGERVEPMAEERFYVRIQGKVVGPFGVPQLRALRDRGQLRTFHEVSSDKQAWSAASSLAGVFPASGAGEADAIRLETVSEERPAAVKTRAPDAPDDAAEWYCVDDQAQQRGPLTRAALAALLHSGEVSGTSLIWKQGMAEWVPLARFEHLFAAKAGAAPETSAASPSDVGQSLVAFLLNPVGELPRLAYALGPAAAFGLGLTLGIFFVIWVLLGMVLTLDRDLAFRFDFFNLLPFGRPSKIIILAGFLALLLWVSLTGAVAIIRLVTRGKGSFGYDALAAGTALLPLGVATPLDVLLGPGNLEIIAFLNLTVLVFAILVLNCAFTRVIGLSDRGAVFAVPASLVGSMWLLKVITVAILHALE